MGVVGTGHGTDRSVVRELRAAIEASDDVVFASNPVNAADRDTGELRVYERGEFAYFHARCWRDDNAAGWIERQRGPFIDLAKGSA